jgi:hypothetical protein
MILRSNSKFGPFVSFGDSLVIKTEANSTLGILGTAITFKYFDTSEGRPLLSTEQGKQSL